MIQTSSGLGTNLQCIKAPRRETLKCCQASLAKLPSKPSVPLTDAKVCSKRHVLLGGASLLLAPLLVHHASAKPSSADNKSATFKGFDGLGGAYADYANAQVCHLCDPANLKMASILISYNSKQHLQQYTYAEAAKPLTTCDLHMERT